MVLSVLCTETGSARMGGREGGAGEEGRLVGRKKGDLSTFISRRVCKFCGFETGLRRGRASLGFYYEILWRHRQLQDVNEHLSHRWRDSAEQVIVRGILRGTFAPGKDEENRWSQENGVGLVCQSGGGSEIGT